MSQVTRICLDPGHVEGYNPGCISGYAEGTAVFSLAYYLKGELEKYQDIAVYVTRSLLTDNPSLEARGQFAINNNCEVFISLHTNAYNPAPTACGVSVFRSLHRPLSHALGLELGNAVVNLMKKDTGITYFRGNGPVTKQYSATYPSWDYYGVIRSSMNSSGNSCVKYSYIIEHGFHTNTKECAWLMKTENLKALAKEEARVIAEYFDKSPKVEPDPVTPDVPLTAKEVQQLIDASKEKVYHYWYQIEEEIPWAYKPLKALYSKKIFSGDSPADLNAPFTLIRSLVCLAAALKSQGIINY